jgi:hypothetical protein
MDGTAKGCWGHLINVGGTSRLYAANAAPAWCISPHPPPPQHICSNPESTTASWREVWYLSASLRLLRRHRSATRPSPPPPHMLHAAAAFVLTYTTCMTWLLHHMFHRNHQQGCSSKAAQPPPQTCSTKAALPPPVQQGCHHRHLSDMAASLTVGKTIARMSPFPIPPIPPRPPLPQQPQPLPLPIPMRVHATLSRIHAAHAHPALEQTKRTCLMSSSVSSVTSQGSPGTDQPADACTEQ